jgi:hypothetical protein
VFRYGSDISENKVNKRSVAMDHLPDEWRTIRDSKRTIFKFGALFIPIIVFWREGGVSDDHIPLEKRGEKVIGVVIMSGVGEAPKMDGSVQVQGRDNRIE